MGLLTDGDWSAIPVVTDVFIDDPDDPTPGALVEKYQAIRGVLYAFDQEPAAEVSQSARQTATDVFSRVGRAVMEFKQRADKPGGNHQAWHQLTNAIESGASQLAEVVRPQLRSDATELGKRLLEASELQQKAVAAAEEFQRLEARAKELVDRVGVGRFAEHYEQQAKDQSKAATRWLVGVAVAGGFLALVVVWLIWETLARSSDLRSWEEVGAMLATKALAIGVLSYAVSFCSKNYRAHRHMESTYRQRMAALDTYALMASSLAEDTESRAIVLTELARSAFAPADTGLTSGSSGDRTIIENSAPLMAAARGS